MRPIIISEQIIEDVKRHGVSAIDAIDDPTRRDRIQAAISITAKRRGMRVKTKTQTVEGERLLIVWRVA